MVQKHNKRNEPLRRAPAQGTWRLSQIALACLMYGAAGGASAELLASAKLASVDLTRLSIEELADIEISSVSKKAEPLSDAAAAIFVISNDDIRRSGVTSIPEALRLAPNLEVQRTNANAYIITARGLTNNKLLMLIDGRTVYSSLHSTVFWDVQDVLLEDVERIEVISGPGGTLWGSNAVNGVINITTRHTKDTAGTLLSAGAGGDQRSLAARYGTKLGEDASFRLYAKGDDYSHSNTAAGVNQQDAWRKTQAGFRTDWSQGIDALTLQGDVYNGVEDQNMLAGTSLSGGNLLGRWNHTLDNGGVQLQAYYDRTKRLVPGTFGETVDTYDIDAQHGFKLGERHDILWGGGYRLMRDQVSNLTPIFAFLPTQRNLTLGNVFIQDTITLSEHLKLTLGEKLERNSYTGWESQPSARLAWKMNEHSLLWGAVSRAVRTPSRLDRDFYVFIPILPLQGGPDFKSEKLIAYELGYRSQPTPKLSYSVSTFYNNYDALRSVETGPTPGSLVLGNKIQGHTYGVELWGNYQATEAWRLSAGFNALRESFSFKSGSIAFGSVMGTTGNATAASGQDPAYQFSLRSSLNLPHDTEFDLTLRSIGALANTNTPNTAVPAYTTADARFGWHLNKQLELSLSGFNLFGRSHAETGTAPVRSEFGRSFFLKLLWKS